MIQPGEIISHHEMCGEEHASLQRGMNFRLATGRTVILMSRRPNAPYTDAVKDEGQTIVYEGHDVPKSQSIRDPKSIDQESHTRSGRLTQNGKFAEAAAAYQEGRRGPEEVRVYEKLRDGVWVFNGTFRLTNAWQEPSGGRTVFKFRLEVTIPTQGSAVNIALQRDLEHNRVIPSDVKVEVYQRDKGRCVQCGSADNLHFDHILPFSRGGTSLRAENIQLLCARHNLAKAARIE